MTVQNKGNLFDPTLVTDLINKVKGFSSLAVLAKQEPIPFNGSKEFTFTLDSEVDVVAESGAKSHGGLTVAPVTIVPIKVEYGARVSDEFLYAADEEKIKILQAFNDGFAKKVARGLDLMAFHGVNPRSATASAVIGNNHFDYKVSQTVPFVPATPDDNIESAVALVQGSEGEVTGLAASPVFSAALANYKVNNVKQFPELAWGARPNTLNGLSLSINKTVSDMSPVDVAIMGDFAGSFKWGYAKQIPLEVIKYGDPDNSGLDLKGYNQVYIRAEVYLGWGILDPLAFARIVEEDPVTPLTVTLKKGSVTGTTATNSIAPTKDASNSYLVKRNGVLPRIDTVLTDGEDGWTAYTAGTDIPVYEGETIALAEVVTSGGKIKKGAVVEVEANKIKE